MEDNLGAGVDVAGDPGTMGKGWQRSVEMASRLRALRGVERMEDGASQKSEDNASKHVGLWTSGP